MIQQILFNAYVIPVVGPGSSSAVKAWYLAAGPQKYIRVVWLKMNTNDGYEPCKGQALSALETGNMGIQPDHGTQKRMPWVKDVYLKNNSNIGDTKEKQ